MRILKRLLLYAILIFYCSLCSAQSGFYLFANTGYAFNESTTINREKLKDSRALLFDLGASYKFKLIKSSYAEVGLAGRLIAASGEISNVSFNAQTWRMQMPLKVGLPVAKKWAIATGGIIQNNKDVLDADFREKYFWRFNLIGEVIYNWTGKWFLTGALSYELRDVPEGYLVNDPRMAVVIGISRRL